MGEKTLTDEQIKAAAESAGLEYAALKAVAVVESSGSGFLPDGQPKILFEGHVFWKELKKRGVNPADHLTGNENILYPSWTKKYYRSGTAEHARLEQAAAINREAALSSASWGLFQIMGFNFKLAGFAALQDFINAMYQDESAHLQAALGFIGSAGLLPALKRKDWAAFAKGYNGAGYAANKYDKKLAAAYAAAKKAGVK
jgi:hypothetical protein